MMCIWWHLPLSSTNLVPWAPASQGRFSPPSCFFDSLHVRQVGGPWKPSCSKLWPWIDTNNVGCFNKHLLFLILARSVRSHEIPQGFSYWTFSWFAKNSPWFGRKVAISSKWLWTPIASQSPKYSWLFLKHHSYERVRAAPPQDLFKTSVSNTCHSEEGSRIAAFPKWCLLKLGQSQRAPASEVALLQLWISKNICNHFQHKNQLKVFNI